MKNSSHDQLSKRFAILSLLQVAAIFACIFLSIQYFGQSRHKAENGVAVILANHRDTPGWTSSISRGLQAACDQLDYNLYVEDEVDRSQLGPVAEKLIHRGVKHIILANPDYQSNLEHLAKKYPQINFYTNSVGETVSPAITKYSVRYYEVRYMAGVLAGLHTKTGVVGYIAPFPAPETRRDLNAFAMGVQSVRPEARILVRWTEYWINPSREQEAVYILKHAGADVMTYFLATNSAAMAAQAQNLDYIDFHANDSHLAPGCLAAIETDWQKVFLDILRNNEIQQEKTLYWQGMLDQVVTMRLSPKLTPTEEALTIRTREKILQGYPVFSGTITDQYGVLRCHEGEAIAASALLRRMDWLVKGVEIVESR